MTRVNLIESRGTSFDFSSKFRESNFPGERIYASKIFGKRSISSMGSVDKSVDNFIGYFLLFSSAGLKIVAGDRIPRNYYNFEQGGLATFTAICRIWWSNSSKYTSRI